MKTFIATLFHVSGKWPYLQLIDKVIEFGNTFSTHKECVEWCKEHDFGRDSDRSWQPCVQVNDKLYRYGADVTNLVEVIKLHRSNCWIEAIQVGRQGIKAYYRCNTLEEGWNILKEYNEGCMLSIFYESEEMQEGNGLICKTLDDLLKYIYR